MSTLLEIETAARQLPAAQRQQLLIAIAQSLRSEGRPLPEPRRFSSAEIKSWIREDERDMSELKNRT